MGSDPDCCSDLVTDSIVIYSFTFFFANSITYGLRSEVGLLTSIFVLSPGQGSPSRFALTNR